MISHRCLARLLFCLIGSFSSLAVWAEEIDFDRDVLPILSDRCFLCHGPDAGTNESGLRLDSFAEATKSLPSGDGYAIVAGQPKDSEILHRMETSDASLKMPPPESNLAVNENEIQILRKWIDQGAKYKKHWAFELLPSKVDLPTVTNVAWPKNGIDYFVLSQFENKGLHPSPAAERWRWLRRVTHDLTGLPPTPEETSAFLEDQSETAYEKVVDRLLQSPRYGEAMAVSWLDAARYADSYGYQSDQLNTQWPYRDWVVKAFNENLPYDQFLTHQIAGDMLPNATREQRLATAFNRLHRMTNEGGGVFEEWRIEGVADRVHTFGTAVLGLTLECSRCHDHKYDPISMRDYYSLSAFFNSIDEYGLYDQAAKVPSPSMLLPSEEQEAALKNAFAAIKSIESRLPIALLDVVESQNESATFQCEIAPQEIAGRLFSQSFNKPYNENDASNYYAGIDNNAKTSFPEVVEVDNCKVASIDSTSETRKAVRLDGEVGITVNNIPAFDRWTPFTVVLNVKLPDISSERMVIAHHSRGTDAGYNGWDLTIVDGFIESRLYRVWPGNAIGVRSLQPAPFGEWVQLVATYDGSMKASGLGLHIDAKRIPTEVLRDNSMKAANVAVSLGGHFAVGQRFRSRGLKGALLDEVQIYNRELESTELMTLFTGKPQRLSLAEHLSIHDPSLVGLQSELHAARKRMVEIEESIHEIPVMEELEQPRETHILARGQYDADTSESTRVTRAIFAELEPAVTSKTTLNRLDLARWVTDPSNPLTSRVAVNRLWANFFGSGLVETAENFGRQGSRPTHPQLLDWLARDFVNHGWDVKRVCKQIVLSATYMQDSKATPTLMAEDPENKLFARGPAYRLEAEEIRDSALHVAGLLDTRVGGPPVSPYQAGGDLWRESNSMSPAYQQSVGKDLYRRSLYSVWKRTAPLPNMLAFDASSREVCTVKRSRTNTPLQALVLLNDTQFIEACRVAASHFVAAKVDSNSRIQMAFEHYCSRAATPTELSLLQRLHDEELVYFAQNPESAQQLLSVGETRIETDSTIELAAMTIICQAIQNLDAVTWSR